MNEETWSAIVSDWKAQPETPLPDLDTVTRAARRQAASVAAEFVASAAVVAFWLYFLTTSPTGTTIALASATGVFLAIYLTVLVSTLRHTWRVTAETTTAYVALTRRRLEAKIKWFTFVRLSSIGFGAFMLAWAVGFALSDENPGESVIDGLVAVGPGMAGVFAILGGIFYFSGRSRTRAHQELDTLTTTVDADAPA